MIGARPVTVVITSAEAFAKLVGAKRFLLDRSKIAELSFRLDAIIESPRINGLDCITLFISAFDSKYISEKLHPSNGTIAAILIGLSVFKILTPKGFLKSY